MLNRIIVFVIAALLLVVSAPQSHAQFVNVQTLGATGGNSSKDTAAFQAAVNTAGAGIILIPPAPSCYQITSLNVSGKSDLIFMGQGAASCLQVAGADSAGNWIDLTGASRIVFRDINVIGSSGSVPKVLFLWARASGGPVDESLVFDNVRMDAFSTVAHFYAYGFNGLDIRGGKWFQRQNGSANSNPSQRTTVIRIDAENSAGLSSANATIQPCTQNPNSGSCDQITWNTSIQGTQFIDWPSGFGSGTQDNNTAFDCVTCGLFIMNGGAIESEGQVGAVMWWFAEGVAFHSTAFMASDGSINTTYFVALGGGVTGNVELDNAFFSVAVQSQGGSPVAVWTPDPKRGGGASYLRIVNPDVGGGYSGEHLLTVIPCSSAYTGGPWLVNSEIEAPNMSIVVCGTVEPSVTLRGVSAVDGPGGGGYSISPGAEWGPP